MSQTQEHLPPLPLADLAAQQKRLRPEIERRMAEVLAHGRYILGPEVGELEQRLAAFAGCRHAVGVASGTDALLVALMARGVGPGDAVFVPAFTFPATAEVPLLLGARPVFVDVDARTFNLSLDDLSEAVTKVRSQGALVPRAIIAVDLFGLPADYPRLHDLAREQDMFVLGDAAQSFGGAIGERRVGALTEMTAISFFPAKPLGCYGDGGALLTDSDALAETARSIRAHGKGMGKGAGKYDIARVGLNSRLDTLQAAILLAKLDVFADEIAARERVACAYDSELAAYVTVPMRPEGTHSAWAQYSVLVEDEPARDRLAATLKGAGIATAIYYPRPLHRQPAYADCADRNLPVSDSLCTRILSLPMHPYLTDADIARVCRAVADGRS